MHVIDVRMPGLLAQEAVRRGLGLLEVARLIMRIDQLELRLLRFDAELEPRFDAFERLDRAGVVEARHLPMRVIVQLGRGLAARFGAVAARTTGDADGDEDEQQGTADAG